MSPDYEYTSLADARSVRLIHLVSHPSAIVSRPCFAVSVHPIGNAVSYSALSYTWGPATSSGSTYGPGSLDDDSRDFRLDIILDGKVLQVMPNLRSALARIFAAEPDIYLWVDAICINQNNTAERNSQVSLMGEIYSKASEVIVWLGEEDSETRDTVDLVMMISQAARVRDSEGNLVHRKGVGYLGYKDRDRLQAIGLPFVEEEQWRMIMRFYERRWFERLWVVQEIAMPHVMQPSGQGARPLVLDSESWRHWRDLASERRESIRVMCGSVKIPWEELVECSEFLHGTGIAVDLFELKRDEPAESRSQAFSTGSLHVMRAIKGLCQGELVMCHGATGWNTRASAAAWLRALGIRRGHYNMGSSFCVIQFLLHHFQASDPRDKVFGVSGILQSIGFSMGFNDSSLLFPEYTKPVEEIYRQASVSVAKSTQQLHFLTLIADPSSRNFNLPSWTNDLSVPGPIPLTFWGKEEDHDPRFNADRGSAPAHISFSADDSILHIRGLRLDSFSDVGDSLNEIIDEVRIDRCANLILKCDEIYINGQTRLEAFWRTMITDQTLKDYPAPPEIGPQFFKLLQHFLRQKFFKIITDDLYHAIERGETMAELYVPTMPNLYSLAKADPTGQMPSVEQTIEYCAELMRGGPDYVQEVNAEADKVMESMKKVIDHLRRSTLKRLFRTEKGYLGMGFLSVLPGDEVWIVAGVRVPFVLRRCGEDRRYRLFGQCYVHGFMQGEGVPSEDPGWEHIELE